MENNNANNGAPEGNIQKFYVDSPAFDDDDDDRYKYVSTNVDDFDENQLNAFMMNNSPADKQVQDTVPWSDQQSFKLHNGNPVSAQRRNQNSFQLPRDFEVADEAEELRAEEKYQAELQIRLTQQSRAVDQLGIPPLDLPEEEEGSHDSQSSAFGKLHEISIRDSLDADEFQKLKDQERLKLLIDDDKLPPEVFHMNSVDRLENQPAGDDAQRNPFRLDLNELKQSRESSRNSPKGQDGVAPPQGDDPRLQQMFQQQPQQDEPSSQSHRAGSYQQAPYYEASSVRQPPMPKNKEQTSPIHTQYNTKSMVAPKDYGTPMQNQYEGVNEPQSLHQKDVPTQLNEQHGQRPSQGNQEQQMQQFDEQPVQQYRKQQPMHHEQHPVHQYLDQQPVHQLVQQPVQQYHDQQPAHQYHDQPIHQYREQHPVQQYGDQQSVHQYHKQQPVHQYCDQHPVHQYPDQQTEQPFHEQHPGNQYRDQQPMQRYRDQQPMHQYRDQQPVPQYLDQQPMQHQLAQPFHEQQQSQQLNKQQTPQFYDPQAAQNYHHQQPHQYHDQQQYLGDQPYQQYQGPDQYYGHDGQHQFELPQESGPQEEFHQPLDGALSKHDPQSSASSRISSDVGQKEKPRIDFMSRNKKEYSKAATTSKNSYSRMFTQRKQVKENLPPTPAQGKRRGGPLRAKHPAQDQNDNTSGTFVMAEKEDEPQTAEELWLKRSQALSNVRKATGPRSGVVKKGQHNAVLQKYPSEGSVNKAGSAPPKLNPIRRSPRQAFTEPLRSELDLDPGSSGVLARHTMFTDDGQKVSVDINLKLLSPRPATHNIYQPANQPLQQHPQMPAALQSSQMTSPMRMPAGHYQHGPPPPMEPQDSAQWGGYYNQPDLPQQQHHHQQQDGGTHEHLGHQQVHSAVDQETLPSYRSGKPASPLGSPFKILPPIGSADSSKRESARSETTQPNSDRKTKTSRAGSKAQKDVVPPKDNSSYLEQMRRTKERKLVEFKQYTVEDYKKLKNEVRLGGLGPDFDSNAARERREKRERQAEYAKTVSSKNKRILENTSKTSARKPESEEEDSEVLQRRRAALEYAKNVPKPKIKQPAENPASTPVVERTLVPKMTPSMGRRSMASTTPSGKPVHNDNENDFLDLETLQRRHEQEKQKAALIRQQIHTGNV